MVKNWPVKYILASLPLVGVCCNLLYGDDIVDVFVSLFVVALIMYSVSLIWCFLMQF